MIGPGVMRFGVGGCWSRLGELVWCEVAVGGMGSVGVVVMRVIVSSGGVMRLGRRGGR